MVLEKTLETPLDCKEIQPVHSEGDQPWDFFGYILGSGITVSYGNLFAVKWMDLEIILLSEVSQTGKDK